METTDTMLNSWLNAEEEIARGGACPDCGAEWRWGSREFMGHDLMPSRDRELRHSIECPQRSGFVEGNLGRITGEIVAIIESYSESMDDPIMRASGCADEFAPAIWNGVLDKVQRVLDRYDLSWDYYMHLVEERTSSGWAYLHTNLYAVDPVEVV